MQPVSVLLRRIDGISERFSKVWRSAEAVQQICGRAADPLSKRFGEPWPLIDEIKTTMKTTTGTLRDGLKIGPDVFFQFEMREATASDLFAAEQEVGIDREIAFNGVMMARQLVSMESFKGPFTLDDIGRLSSVDFATLRRKQGELEAGEKFGPASLSP